MALNGVRPIALSDGYGLLRLGKNWYYVPLLEISSVSAGARGEFSAVYVKSSEGESATFVRCEDETLVKDISDCFRSACGN